MLVPHLESEGVNRDMGALKIECCDDAAYIAAMVNRGLSGVWEFEGKKLIPKSTAPAKREPLNPVRGQEREALTPRRRTAKLNG